jgi:tetratricopeptide (TPR) repeat protein
MIFKFRITAYCLLLSLFFSFQALADENIEYLVKRGLDNCYHFRWKSAEQDFQRIIDQKPGDPRGYHYLSGIYLWHYLTSGSKSDFNHFLKYSDIALSKGEALLDKSAANELINLILGNAYSYRALGYVKAGSYVNAIWASKKSEKILKKVIELNPGNYDAYLGLGLYNFAAAQIPSAFKWALSLAGISGEEETGISYIKLAAEKGNLNKVEAQYYLSQLLTGVIYDFKTAGEMLNSLHNKYPSNILFSYALAVVHLKQKDTEGAEKLLKNIVKSNHTRFIQVISFANFLLGDVYFRRNEFREAPVYYNKFIETTTTRDYKGIAFLRMGLCFEMTQDEDKAKEYYNRIPEGNSDIEEDVFARRKGDILKKQGLSKDERALLQYANMNQAGRYKLSLNNLLTLIDSTSNELIKAEAYFNISEAAFEMGKYEDALIYALKGAESETGNEGWINAWSYYYAARISKHLGKKSDMIKYLGKAEDNNRWDYQNQVENLIKSLKRESGI